MRNGVIEGAKAYRMPSTVCRTIDNEPFKTNRPINDSMQACCDTTSRVNRLNWSRVLYIDSQFDQVPKIDCPCGPITTRRKPNARLTFMHGEKYALEDVRKAVTELKACRRCKRRSPGHDGSNGDRAMILSSGHVGRRIRKWWRGWPRLRPDR